MDSQLEAAVNELEAKLRPFPWFLFLGVNDPAASDPALMVFVKSKRHAELKELLAGWRGYTVEIVKTGAPRPATA